MPKQYTREKLWKIYEGLPKEIKEAIFSEKMADQIQKICQKYEITNEKSASGLAKYIGDVLLGVLPPKELGNLLTFELKLKKEIVNNLIKEIEQSIFQPVDSGLEKIYGTGAKSAEILSTEEPQTTSEKHIKKTDTYRETI